ncbi:YTH domain-containing protein 1-like [Adelges cooleyi]|uniref:YTH domain-containing protein 1-like n=1 Tax=Adelges cooleyi TaxID=133065 RepID=UPI00217F709C|nr:YTH domain-containing protein 1-like [Adelges cooleyi]
MAGTVDDSTADSMLVIKDQQVVNEINKDMDGIEKDKKQPEEEYNTNCEPSTSAAGTSADPQEDSHNVTIDNPLPSDARVSLRKFKNNTQLKLLFENARYFVVKTNCRKYYQSIRSNYWPTDYWNKVKFNTAFRSCKHVFLIFSHKKSRQFLGFARISEGSYNVSPFTRVRENGTNVSGMFKFDWVSKKRLPYRNTLHLYNCSGKPVSKSRNGEELGKKSGMRLCLMLLIGESIDLQYILNKSDIQQRNKTTNHSRRHLNIDRPTNMSSRVPSLGQPSNTNARVLELRHYSEFVSYHVYEL